MTEGVMISMISAGTTLAVGILSLLGIIISKQNAAHKQINSRMDELLHLTKVRAEQVGNLEGRAELKEEQKLEEK